MTPPYESTPPWKWHRNSEGDEVNLYDANDVIVACPATTALGPVTLVASPKVAELLRAAPEMEALLKELAEAFDHHSMQEPGLDGRELDAIEAARALLARIDERSKGT